jgi:hypothetical protein
LFSVGSRTSTGHVSSTVYAGIRAAAKTPLPEEDGTKRLAFGLLKNHDIKKIQKGK